MPTYAVGQRLTAALLQELADLIEDSTVSASVTSDSAGFTTTEVTVITLVAYLTAGNTYQLSSYGRISSGTAADVIGTRIRLTNTAGTEIQAGQVSAATTSSTGFSNSLNAEYTASVTGNQTFVLTAQRTAGGGTCVFRAASTAPGWLTCRLKSG